jgi:hypothetical protein
VIRCPDCGEERLSLDEKEGRVCDQYGEGAEQEAKAVAYRIYWTNMGFSIAGLIFLILGIIMLIKR